MLMTPLQHTQSTFIASERECERKVEKLKEEKGEAMLASRARLMSAFRLSWGSY